MSVRSAARMRRFTRLAMMIRGQVLGAALVAAATCLLVGGQVAAQTQPETRRGDRRVVLEWSQEVELADSLFGGYNVWRSITPDPADFMLLRRFQRRYPVSWTYSPPSSSPCTPFESGAGTCRAFVDPDSVVAYEKIQITSQGDSAMTRRYLGISPFNGFPYHYAVTWFSECLSNRNDTLWVDMPQPEIFTFMRGGVEHYGFETDTGDTLEVTRTPCRRINPLTNTPTGDTTFVYYATVESQVPLRLYAIETASIDDPVYPAARAQSSLFGATVIPNPYVASAPWDEPGRRKIQFVNLTAEATVRIFTAAGDLVRVLEHPAPGAPADQGSIDWDLKNGAGRLVESGIYIWQVEDPRGVADVVGRLVIVR